MDRTICSLLKSKQTLHLSGYARCHRARHLHCRCWEIECSVFLCSSSQQYNSPLLCLISAIDCADGSWVGVCPVWLVKWFSWITTIPIYLVRYVEKLIERLKLNMYAEEQKDWSKVMVVMWAGFRVVFWLVSVLSQKQLQRNVVPRHKTIDVSVQLQWDLVRPLVLSNSTFEIPNTVM